MYNKIYYMNESGFVQDAIHWEHVTETDLDLMETGMPVQTTQTMDSSSTWLLMTGQFRTSLMT